MKEILIVLVEPGGGHSVLYIRKFTRKQLKETVILIRAGLMGKSKSGKKLQKQKENNILNISNI